MADKTILKLFLFFFNLLFWVIGAAIFGLSLWIRFDLDFEEMVVEMKFYHLWTGAYVFMAASIIVMSVSFFGCCGAISENQVLLIVTVVFHGICAVLQLAGAAFMLGNGTRASPMLTDWLRDIFKHLISTYETNLSNRRIMRIIQENIGCCGADGANDWTEAGSSAPPECRDPVTGHEYKYGCVDVFAAWLEKMSGPSSGLALVLCVLQIIGILLTLKMWRMIEERTASASVHYRSAPGQLYYRS